MAPAAIAIEKSGSLPDAAAVAGRPLLSVEILFGPLDVRLAKKIERATGRRGLPVTTYRYSFCRRAALREQKAAEAAAPA
jgi:hypothetical protein